LNPLRLVSFLVSDSNVLTNHRNLTKFDFPSWSRRRNKAGKSNLEKFEKTLGDLGEADPANR